MIENGSGPRKYVGESVRRGNALRLLQGRTRYVDDARHPRMVHVAFLRSPYAHCRILGVDATAAKGMPGVVGVFTWKDLSGYCKAWTGTLKHLTGMASTPQELLARDIARWQGEPVVAVAAESRAQAEDALGAIDVDFEELQPLATWEAALAASPISSSVESNVCFDRRIDVGNVDAAFESAHLVVEQTLHFGRQTVVAMEGRSIIADWNPADRMLGISHSTQVPHMIRDVVADLFSLKATDVRVTCGDVGGSFGLKIHIYPDEMATIAISRHLARPAKFVADRLESFVTDIQARHHEVTARMALSKEGMITALEVEDTAPIGAYSMFPRTSGTEGNQVINYVGGPYLHRNYRAHLRCIFQNKVPTSQFRAVGHPIACAIAESLIDEAARRLCIDPIAIRERNVIPDDSYPYTSPSGMRFESLSHQAALRETVALIQYQSLRDQQRRALEDGRYLGIGIATMIEMTNPGPSIYATGGARISSQDGATLRLEPDGSLTVLLSVGEQGQGTETAVSQIAADSLGIKLDHVRVLSGDTMATPMGGGTWGSRGIGIGGEAVLQAGMALKSQVLAVASELLSRPQSELDIHDGVVTCRDSGGMQLSLGELARVAYYAPDGLRNQPELCVTRHYMPRDYPVAFTNGVQAAFVEVDIKTGFVRLLKHWVVEDCGTVVNPLLADEQIRGGVVQGLGYALFEECLYDENAQLLNATLADYLVPMASEMPDIEISHLCTPTRTSVLGAKGVAEAGTCGAPAAVLNAVNDALASVGARVNRFPITPERVLDAVASAAASQPSASS